MRTPFRAALALLALFLLASPARADHWIWFSPLDLRPNAFTGYEDNIFVDLGSPSSAIRITVDEPNTYPVDLPMNLPNRHMIDSVAVCYENGGEGSYIDQVRLTLMRTPAFAEVWHDDAVILGGTGVGCYREAYLQGPPPLYVSGAAHLTLFLDMDPADYVEIGAIGVYVRGEVTGIADTRPAPALVLAQNYPNPLRARTWISFRVESPAPVSVEVYDTLGRRVRTLLDNGNQPAGDHRVEWDARDDQGNRLPSGIYTYRVRIADRVGARRMVLVR